MANQFEWDEAKAASNWEKHVVSFEEGASVFDDPLRLDELDSEHSTPEETRYLAVGISSQNNLIVVWYTERYEGDEPTIRIIGCREATKKERRRYLDEQMPQ